MDTAATDALGTTHPLARHIGDFLTDLANAGKPDHTVRAYRGDLITFAVHHDDEIGELTATPIRAYLGCRGFWNGIRRGRAFPQFTALFGLDAWGVNCLHSSDR